LPLVLLHHFRGNLDNWDPALTDALAAEREVIVVDYPGVGSSTGEPSRSIADTARRMIGFGDALGLDRIDLLGFSIGGFVAQVRPTLIRRLVLAATGPKGGARHARLARRHRGRRARREQARAPAVHHVRPHRREPGEGQGVPRPLHAAPGGTHRRATPPATRNTTRSSNGGSRTPEPCSG
jgi:pimeloyl-ACP methyl ester carboxylesterase